jgi:uncharacterized membrane protein
MIPLHPRIVHFPVALLISAAVFGILALLFKNKRKLFKEVLFWNLLFGLIGAIAAVLTGLREEDTIIHNYKIHTIMEIHKLLGLIFTGIFLLLFVWMFIRKLKMKTGELAAFTVILVLTAGLLGYSAHLGGKMVYKEGAGVIPMQSIIIKQGQYHHHGNAEISPLPPTAE